jgi:ribosomal protein L16 Arg81 hydroxylase
VFYVDGESASDVNQLFHSYHQGNTAVLNFAQCYWEPAARLCSAMEKFFHFPAGVNVYITPRGAQGFPPHFDAHDVFILQVEGSKSWRIYDSWRASPGASASGSGKDGEQDAPVARELLGEPRHELRLNAGDLLYVPRGHVHEARTTDSSSIHVSISVRAYTWSDLIAELVASESLDDAELRAALPVGFSDSETALELIEDRLPALFRALAESRRVGTGSGACASV